MPFLETVAAVSPGEKRVRFAAPVRSEETTRYTATLKSVFAVTVPATVAYGLNVTTAMQGNIAFEYHMKDLYNEPKPLTVQEVFTRVRTRDKPIKDYFEPIKTAPTLTYNSTNKKVEVTLPPSSAIYTTDPLFFAGIMGMTNVETRTEKSSVAGGVDVVVYGFWNATLEEAILESEEKVPPNTIFMDDLKTDKTITNFPAQTHVFTAVGKTSQGYSISKRKADAATAAATIPILLITDRVHRLPKNLFKVVLEDENTIAVTNAAYPGSTVTVTLDLFLSCKSFFAPTTLAFELGSETTLRLKGESFGTSPFENRFPLTLLREEAGEADSYVNELGFVSVLAVIEDETTVRATGVELGRGRQSVTVAFLDKYLKPIAFDKTTNVYLTFDLAQRS